jgi:uncharacterized protein (TIGR02147 family)
MNIFSTTDYREALRSAVKARKQTEKKFTFAQLAEAARVQRPYLSKVLKGTADLNADQLYLISARLQLSHEEQDYLQLLLSFERTGVASRRTELKSKILQLAEKHTSMAQHTSAAVHTPRSHSNDAFIDYYLDPFAQIVHMGLVIPRFSREPAALAGELGISPSYLNGIILQLERLGLITRTASRITTKPTKLFLSKDSPVFRSWRNLVKGMSMQRLNQLPESETFFFSTTFSSDAETYAFIRRKFLEVIKECEPKISAAKDENVYSLTMEAYPWTR